MSLNNGINYIVSCETMEQVDKCLRNKKLSTVYVDSHIFGQNDFVSELSNCIEKIHKAQKMVFLRLPVIFRKHTAVFFESIVAELKKMPLDGMVVRNYEEVHFVSTNFPQIMMVADYNLYTYNDVAKASFEESDVTITTIPLELNQKEIRGRDNHNSEMVIYGYYPLMVTANCVHKNTLSCDKKSGVHYLKDRYNVLFPVKNFCGSCYNVIYNSIPTCLFEEQDKLYSMDVCRMRLELTIEKGDEITNVLDSLEGRGKEIESTKGHYKRGVE